MNAMSRLRMFGVAHEIDLRRWARHIGNAGTDVVGVSHSLGDLVQPQSRYEEPQYHSGKPHLGWRFLKARSSSNVDLRQNEVCLRMKEVQT